MDLKELFIYREQLLDECKDSEGYVSDGGFIDYCVPSLNETKYIDTTDLTEIYDVLESGALKLNAYLINESGERLQLFIVNEDSISYDIKEEQIKVSQKNVYEKQFNRAFNFFKKGTKKQLNDLLQDGSPVWLLIHQLENVDFWEQIDVIEIFLLSATITIESRGTTPSLKMLEFDDDKMSVNYRRDNTIENKDVLIKKRLIDLNFLFNVQISQGSRYPLKIDFTESPYNYPIPFLHAANEKDFDSYLCSIPGALLAELYKHNSSRLLEKNVRSFLQLKGVNKGMQETIKKEPEKFIAYNNGLTITSIEIETIEKNGIRYIKSLSDLQIVNGGQTTATLYFSSKAGYNLDSIRVMAKINVAKNASDEDLDDLISNISTYSNAQSKVSKVDLRARSPQLVKLKSLSESVLTTSGKKWFFERAKGEYATMMRINSNKKAQLEKAYPKERRFTKEELAKYYCSWGDKPYAVKKGGEKIFRNFLEELSDEGKNKKGVNINRAFYEDLIARIILFKELEKIYGSGNNSLGQIRSAVVPYSISALYEFTNGTKKSHPFDLLKIWQAEKLDDELKVYFKRLMVLVNNLIKTYSRSDDLGEYAKKHELWEDLKLSPELDSFMNEKQNLDVIRKYSVSQEELKRREKNNKKEISIDFEPLINNANIFDHGAEFYSEILLNYSDTLSDNQVAKLNSIIYSIKNKLLIEVNILQFVDSLLKEISINNSKLFSTTNSSDRYRKTVNLILKKYDSAISKDNDVKFVFEAQMEVANIRKASNYLIWSEIGKRLSIGELPSMLQVYQVSEYCMSFDS